MSVRPTKFSEIIGQNRVKTVCETLYKSAQIRDAAVPHVLYSGPPGTGKTTIALAMANEVGAKLIKANGGIIKSLADLQPYISMLNRKDILFIDEVHRIPIKVCESLYTVMEDFRYELLTKAGPKSESIPEFTLIGATTDIGSMPKPLKDRFKFTAEFEQYTLDELTDISVKVAEGYEFKMPKTTARKIAKTCRNNPRHVVSRTEWIRDYMLANKKKRITSKELMMAIQMQGFDEDGLTPTDHRYMNVVINDGPVGLASISSKINVHPMTIVNDIEPFLLQNDLIKITTAGREI
jgi:holliday junction DNA helicase RuvB